MAVGTTVLLLTGCGPGAHPGTVPHAHPDTAPSATQPGPAPRRPLTLLPPGCAPGQVRLGAPTHDGAGGTLFTIFPLRLVRGAPCTLWGTPAVRLTAPGGRPLLVRYSHRWYPRPHVGPVELTRSAPQSFALATSRCDTGPALWSRRLSVVLPNGAGSLRTSARIGACAPGVGSHVVRVGAVGDWVTGPEAPPRRVVVSMHSAFDPQGLPTWGRSDLDGDGHRDTVVVRTTGLVTARLASRNVRLRLPRQVTLRLQGFTDLTGDGRPDVLVASSALGCTAGYRLCASGTSVLTLVHHRLRVVRFPNDRPQWDDGQGDLFQGWVCHRDGPTEVDVQWQGVSEYLLTRIRYRVLGLRAHVVSRRTTHGTGTYPDLMRLSRTRCPGLDSRGWAPERGPLG